MGSKLKEAVILRDGKAVKKAISSLEGKENWSLVTIIDELLPLALMESNLRFGNFHSVKMALFLRRLAVEGYFSKATEREIARVIALELVEREWVSIHADRAGYTKRDTYPSPDVFQILEQKPKETVDWLFRLYASHYTRAWDPHYYTGLYSVLRLCMGNKIRDKVACRMALEQALYYFAEDLA